MKDWKQEDQFNTYDGIRDNLSLFQCFYHLPKIKNEQLYKSRLKIQNAFECKLNTNDFLNKTKMEKAENIPF